ncbi:hypothetical protein GCM10025786_30380 [Nocardioides caeni]|uniref:N-acetylmuramoyl-L-alanine amidase n=2 Tax=Nocardioides caeni TaxID=574700 RepID=A0A4V4HJ65_9ACTN|nr:N-acetylmuramoyl-L-alanine amidase [Nocardioides caeni]
MTGLLVGLLLLAGCATDTDPGGTSPASPSATSSASARGVELSPAVPARPLTGMVVVLDPGHQLGNGHHGGEINDPVDAGGFEKACNTTGTATDAGFPEATFTWEVATRMRSMLRRLGARVVMTRDGNSDEEWGPCVDVRGSIGNPGEGRPVGDVRISIHADGVRGDAATGFHVIRPGGLDGWTDDIEADSAVLADDVRDALVAGGWHPSTYRGVDGVDVRTDLGTLNRSDIPAVMVELGNMRDAGEGAVMATSAGQGRYARALVAGVRAWLTR